eukprot:9021049-Pyramimonas_sp.AAC.1
MAHPWPRGDVHRPPAACRPHPRVGHLGWLARQRGGRHPRPGARAESGPARARGARPVGSRASTAPPSRPPPWPTR